MTVPRVPALVPMPGACPYCGGNLSCDPGNAGRLYHDDPICNGFRTHRKPSFREAAARALAIQEGKQK